MKMSRLKASLLDAYRIAGFRTRARIKRHDRDPQALVITLVRSQKKNVCGGCGEVHSSFCDRNTRLARDLSSGDRRIFLEAALGFSYRGCDEAFSVSRVRSGLEYCIASSSTEPKRRPIRSSA